MLKSPAFLGFSMVPRNNRRRLVVIVYAILIGLMAAPIIIFPWAGHRGRALLLASSMVFAYCGVSWAIFGKLVKDTVLPFVRLRQSTGLGLTPWRHLSDDDLDEREVAVRNAAYFAAYRAVAVYSYILWMAWVFSYQLSASIALPLLQLPVVLLLAMVLTLPQAVILWTEPDLPEEARA